MGASSRGCLHGGWGNHTAFEGSSSALSGVHGKRLMMFLQKICLRGAETLAVCVRAQTTLDNQSVRRLSGAGVSISPGMSVNVNSHGSVIGRHGLG